MQFIKSRQLFQNIAENANIQSIMIEKSFIKAIIITTVNVYFISIRSYHKVFREELISLFDSKYLHFNRCLML